MAEENQNASRETLVCRPADTNGKRKCGVYDKDMKLQREFVAEDSKIKKILEE